MQTNIIVDATISEPMLRQSVDATKRHTIKNYYKLLTRLEKGYKDDYLDILNMITFVDMCENNLIEPLESRKIFEYLNNK